ncbi:transcriptional regulator [Xaviernesmea oryzae]|uniref:Transcriptional regulator n=1 Tax=Xaviernesmea oryzae TaxID=464029 RepID=A0A1Q9AWS7_9HYPH|nr:ChrR family anti-sigma-E factor [Xaviernesmea oryzae]OLP59889.1 transcriptional regulator [Xaviernesmea oryzae]SEK47077.1 anti-ECFsigma factor, ChrR [Xaviernesmea oryzae]
MKGVQLDTVDALMAQYAAGMLPEPVHVLVSAHLELRPQQRRKVAAFEAIGGDMIETAAPVALNDADAALARIFASQTQPHCEPAPAMMSDDPLFPAVLRDFVGFGSKEVPWRRKLPGFKEHMIGKIDGCEVSLFWIRPGRTIPAHTHDGLEISLVLGGAFHDGRGRFERGDISVADDSVDHRPIAENDAPCIGMAIVDAPLRFTGPLRQFLGDLIG